MSRENKRSFESLSQLIKYVVQPHKFLFFVVIISVTISSLVLVFNAQYIGQVIDQFITPMLNEGSTDFGPLLDYIIKMAMLFGIGVVSNIIYNQVVVIISQNTLKRLRSDLFNHVQYMPLSFFDSRSHGDIMSHFTNDIDAISSFISQSLPQIVSSIVTMSIILITMIKTNILLTGVIIFFAIVMFLAAYYIGTNSAKYFIEQQNSIGRISGYAQEMFNGLRVVKVFTHEDETKAGFDEVNEQLEESAQWAYTYGNNVFPVIMQLSNMQYVALAVVGGLIAMSGNTNLTLGLVVTFLNLSRAFSRPIAMITNQMNIITMALAGSSRVFSLLAEETESDEGHITMENAIETSTGYQLDPSGDTLVWYDNKTDTITPLKGDIKLEDVYFSYDGKNTVLHDINLFADHGQKVAFVGSTGAGKTTITNLINRFYDIDSGSITYDGIDIYDIKKDDLRRSLGTVLQSVNLFTGTIMENIRFGRLDATDEECIEAAKLTNAHHFIESLPHGYDTYLTDNGASLSTGQRQLISIARAAVANPPVMVLDEATSSIDTRTEKLVQSGMDNLMEDRTVLVIAHRLSTIMDSDKIIVLEKGNIIETGNHKSLMDQKGIYYELQTGMLEIE